MNGLLVVLFLAFLPLGTQAAHAQETTVVYLVRHAEKADDSRDPPLSAAGTSRADLLSGMLGDAGVTRIMSSDYDRTRSTAAPLAERLGLDVEIYDASALSDLVTLIRSTPGRYVVTGHSNTTPALVELLGGVPGEPIRETDEYDRLYVLTLTPDQTTTALLRYGAPHGR
jgi:broad specificity phosphatase PhoE